MSHGQPSSRGTAWKKFESQRSRGSQKREIFKIARGVDSLGLHSPAAQRPIFGSMLSHSFVVVKVVEGVHGVSSGTSAAMHSPLPPLHLPISHTPRVVSASVASHTVPRER
jgi:hypothetical protein